MQKNPGICDQIFFINIGIIGLRQHPVIGGRLPRSMACSHDCTE